MAARSRVGIQRLLEIASEPLSNVLPTIPLWADSPALRDELERMLSRKNGFLAFESALHVLPGASVPGQPDLASWNSPSGWRRTYGSVTEGLLFFAQDAFASQFALSARGVMRFNAESGEIESVASSLEGWAQKVLEEFPFETGWTVLKEWQEEHGPLAAGHRLLPRRPFSLGGDYIASNMVAVPAERGMQMMGRLFEQIRSIPDGSPATVQGWLDFDSH